MTATSSGGSFGIQGENTSTAGTAYGIGGYASGAATTNVGGIFSATGATNNYGLLVTNGNVGIGTTSPNYKLSVLTSGTLGFSVQTYNSTPGGPQIDLYDSTRSQETVISSTDGTITGTYIASYTNHPLLFGTNATSTPTAKMVITTGGNVGIGTTEPVQKLQVVGNIRIDSGTSYNDAGGLFLSNERAAIISNIVNLTANGDTSLDLRTQSAGTVGSAIFINEFRQIGIGTATPRTKTEFVSGLPTSIPTHSNTTNGVVVTDGGDIYGRIGVSNFSAGGNGYPTYIQAGDWSGATYYNLLLNPIGGNVGIGTTSPAYKLQVSGTSYFSGLAHFGQTATSGSAFRWGSLGTAVSPDTMLCMNQLYNGSGWTILEASYGTTAISLGSAVASPAILFETGSANTVATTKMIILNNGNVLINTTTDSGFKLDVSGNSRINLAGDGGIFYAQGASGNTIQLGTDGSGAYIEATGAASARRILRLQAFDGSSSYSQFFINSVSNTAYFNTGLNLLVGTTTDAGYKLDVSGTIRATGDVIAYSDARVKENVETIPNAIDKVKAMRGVGYNKIGEQRRSTGVIAQEILEVLPEVVHQDENGMYSVAYGNIVGVLIEAIKEQQNQIDELKSRLNNL
jgi:hypothetical protein